VIIPALNECAPLASLLRELRPVAGVEVIVVDGGSVDGTPAAARAGGARLLESGGRGRAAQMNAGAAAARAPVFLFLHADTRPPAGFAELIRRAAADPGVAGGAFSFATDSPRRSLRVIARLANWRARRLGLIFGDQAIFARREDFRALGGFPAQPVLEDYEFVRRLRARGRVVLLPEAAVTSARRWHARGPWRNTLLNFIITWSYIAGISPERLARWYHRR
jgi:rSAM/selenodomain-associated transferase 2